MTAEERVLAEIADPGAVRNDVALWYEDCLLDFDNVDWPKVNRAIINRWSESALGYIKDRAWERLHPPARPTP